MDTSTRKKSDSRFEAFQANLKKALTPESVWSEKVNKISLFVKAKKH
jgi:hypothetical protein